ncbi:MAG: HlyD family efflux transporter periplasmic adaptor subunit [bacterium]|nr:HlyD family efflux transporter periplasmic adaptor subunit [bacterium]
MNKKKIIIFGVIAAVIIYNLVYYIQDRMNSDLIIASGNVEVTEANIGFKISGRIAELLADEGQKVTKGEKLARIDDAEQKSIVMQNRSALNEAVARLEELRAGARPQEIKQAELSVKSAEASMFEAEAKLDELRKGLRPQEIEQLQQNVKSQEAVLSESEARLDEMKKGSRPQEIEQAQANLQQAQVELDKAKKDLDRADTLFKNGAVSASQFDAVKSAYDTRLAQYKNASEKLSLAKEGSRKEQILASEQRVEQAKAALSNSKEKLSMAREGATKEELRGSEQRLEQARASYEKAKESLSLVKEGARKEEIKISEQRVEQARAILNTMEERLKDTVLIAPMSGVVLKKNIELGETVGQGIPIYTIGDLENPVIKIYVKETKLGLIKLGQKAEITTDSYPGKKYEGTVTYISSEAEFTPKNIQTKEERIKLVFGVKVSVKNEKDEIKPGMPADVKIILK